MALAKPYSVLGEGNPTPSAPANKSSAPSPVAGRLMPDAVGFLKSLGGEAEVWCRKQQGDGFEEYRAKLEELTYLVAHLRAGADKEKAAPRRARKQSSSNSEFRDVFDESLPSGACRRSSADC